MSSARLHLRQAQAAPSYFWHLAVVAQCACSAGTDPAAWGHGTSGLTEGSHQDPASQCGCHRVRGSLRGADPTAVVGTRCLPPGNSGCAGLCLLWCPDRSGVAVQQDWGDGDVGLVGANPASPFPLPAALPWLPHCISCVPHGPPGAAPVFKPLPASCPTCFRHFPAEPPF